MDGDAIVRITKVEHGIARPGFTEPFHRITFEIVSGDMDPFTVAIWVHQAFPDAEVEHTARLFLAVSLREAAEAASASVRDPDEGPETNPVATPRSPTGPGGR